MHHACFDNPRFWNQSERHPNNEESLVVLNLGQDVRIPGHAVDSPKSQISSKLSATVFVPPKFESDAKLIAKFPMQTRK